MSRSIAFAFNSKFKIADSVFASDVEQEKVILSLKNGSYYGLEQLGSQIWNLLQQSKSLEEIRDAIVRDYEVEKEECEHDIQELLQELLDAELIEVADEQAA